MPILKLLLFTVIVVISVVEANLNDVYPIQLRDKREGDDMTSFTVAQPNDTEVFKKLRSKGEEWGCCVYKTKVWESSQHVWQSANRGCRAPGEFQVGKNCRWSVSYDQQLQMFSIISVDANDTTGGKSVAIAQPIDNAVTATVWFKSHRRAYMYKNPSAPQTLHYCLYYAGNDQQPTCHNISSPEAIRTRDRCIYVYDPVTQQFRFANRTCEGSQHLVDWPSTKHGCFRHAGSWEYTCVGKGNGSDYMKQLTDSLLPLTPVGCCKYESFKTGGLCKDDLWTRAQPDVNCQYTVRSGIDGISLTSHRTIISLNTTLEETTCVSVAKSHQQYHCQCPASTFQKSGVCARSMYNRVAKLSQPPKFCCNHTNRLSNDTSALNKPCRYENLIRIGLNTNCHYILQPRSIDKPFKVLQFIYTEESVESSIGCSRVEYQLKDNVKPTGQYHCHCPGSTDRNSSGCLRGMFDRAEEISKSLD